MKKSAVPLGLSGIYVGKGDPASNVSSISQERKLSPARGSTVIGTTTATATGHGLGYASGGVSPQRTVLMQNTQMTVRSISPSQSTTNLSPPRQSQIQTNGRRPSISPQRASQIPTQNSQSPSTSHSTPEISSSSSKASPPPAAVNRIINQQTPSTPIIPATPNSTTVLPSTIKQRNLSPVPSRPSSNSRQHHHHPEPVKEQPTPKQNSTPPQKSNSPSRPQQATIPTPEKKNKLKEAVVGKTLRSQKMEMRLKSAAERNSDSIQSDEHSEDDDDEVSHVPSSASGSQESSGRTKIYAPDTNTYGVSGSISNRTKRILDKQHKLEGLKADKGTTSTSQSEKQKKEEPSKMTVQVPEKDSPRNDQLSPIAEGDSETSSIYSKVPSVASSGVDSPMNYHMTPQYPPPPHHLHHPHYPPLQHPSYGYPYHPGYAPPGYQGFFPPPPVPGYPPYPPQNPYPYGHANGYGLHPNAYPMYPPHHPHAMNNNTSPNDFGNAPSPHHGFSPEQNPYNQSPPYQMKSPDCKDDTDNDTISTTDSPNDVPHIDAMLMAKQFMMIQNAMKANPSSDSEEGNPMMMFFNQLLKQQQQQQQQQSSPTTLQHNDREDDENHKLQEQVKLLQEQILQIQLQQEEQQHHHHQQQQQQAEKLNKQSSSASASASVSSQSSTPLITPQSSNDLIHIEDPVVHLVSDIIEEILDNSERDLFAKEHRERRARELEALEINKRLLAQIEKLTDEVTTIKHGPPSPAIAITTDSPKSHQSNLLEPPFTPRTETDYQVAAREHKTKTGKELPRVLYRLVPNRSKFKGANELFDSDIDLVVEIASALKAKEASLASGPSHDERESYDHPVSFEYYELAKNSLTVAEMTDGFPSSSSSTSKNPNSRPNRGSKFSVENPLLQTQDDISIHSSSSSLSSASSLASSTISSNPNRRFKRGSKDDLEIDSKSLLLAAACRPVQWTRRNKKTIITEK